MLRVSLLDDVAAPGGHRAEQQGLLHLLGLGGGQLSDVAHHLAVALHLDYLLLRPELDVTLATRAGGGREGGREEGQRTSW